MTTDNEHLYQTKALFERLYVPSPLALYKLALLVVIPVCLLAHGVYWLLHDQSLALTVYAMKLAFVPFIAVSFLYAFPDLLQEKIFRVFLVLTIPVFVFSLSAPFYLDLGISHYYFTDAFGLALTLIAGPVAYALLKRGFLIFQELEKLSAAYLLIVSSYIVLYFIFGNGEKISTSPEMTMPMAIVLSAYVFPSSSAYRPSVWLMLLVAISCVLSQLRENMAAFLLVAGLCAARERGRRSLVLLSLAGIVFAVFFLVRPHTFDRPALFSSNEIGEKIVNLSVKQRQIEIALMQAEMQKEPGAAILGMGFGATYENSLGVLKYFGDRIHNAHSTPAVVYFRNGAYGLFLFVLPLVAALWLVWDRRPVVFRLSLCMLIFYAAMIFNQYLYWNVQYGLMIGILIHSSRKHAN